MTRTEAVFLLNLLVILVYVLLEVMWPARKLKYRNVIWADFSSTVVAYIMALPLIFIIITLSLNRIHHPIYNWFHQWPFYVQFICFALFLDFTMYWAHRLMHVKVMWRTHRWHHYPKYMYFGAGIRASLAHQFLFVSCFLISIPIIQPAAPLWFFIFFKIHFFLFNNFSHMNVVWRSNYLEWFLVTPRAHHVHHSAHHQGNYGSVFMIWDHLFGTYVNPETVKAIEFGTGEKKKHFFQFIGI